MTIFYCILSVFILQFLLTVILIAVHNSNPNIEETREPKELSVIVPFRNEEKRITGLLDCIQSSDIENNIEFIFVNDHSSDNTAEIIIKSGFNVVQSEGKGKKSAIAFGVNQAQFENILTLDADVEFDDQYLNNIRRLPDADLIILPVFLEGKILIQRLGSIDFMWLQLLTFFSSKIGKPFLCNGANLRFSKKAFLETWSNRKDLEIASGDDIFLLKEFKKKGKKIIGFSNKNLRVKTSSPIKFSDLLKQRKRWISKMTKSPNNLMFLSIIIYLLTLFGLFWSIYASFSNFLFLIPIGLKLLSETLIIGNYYRNKDILMHPILPIIHQIFYPIYLIGILFPLGKEKRWDQ